jgi:hypothetical protein
VGIKLSSGECEYVCVEERMWELSTAERVVIGGWRRRRRRLVGGKECNITSRGSSSLGVERTGSGCLATAEQRVECKITRPKGGKRQPSSE